MTIDLKTLHLQRALHYVPADKPSCLDDEALAALVAEDGECLLMFDETGFVSMTDSGPRLSDSLVPAAAYRAAPFGKSGDFEIEAGDYIFFQWRGGDGRPGVPSFRKMLEEVAREIWWRDIECVGPWIVRLIGEGDSVAVQMLRALPKQP